MPKKKWIEVSPTYLTDTKKTPMEAILFVNHCTYNPDAKTPTLRRRIGVQTLAGRTKRDIEDALTAFVTGRGIRLLAEGIESNDYKKLPPLVKNPRPSVVRGTASIYERLQV